MSPVHVEIKDHIATVTIDYPPVNALIVPRYLEIIAAFDSLWDSEARVAVLTGAGERAFCAGADLKSTSASSALLDHGRTSRECFNSVYECPIPVIGAINGPALGGGLCIAASCDYLIASEKATFGLPEIDIGGLGGARHLGRLFPQGFVRRMHYTADRTGADEAYRLGVVTKVVPHEDLMAEAMRDAALIAGKMPIGIRLAKEGLNAIEFMDLKNGYRFEQTRTTALSKTEDPKEARQAFLEKRPPVFKGR